MHALKLIKSFIKLSLQKDMAYRSNFFIRLLHSSLNLFTGVTSLVVIFNQVEHIKGWDFASALGLLGVYLLLSAMRGLFISPSLETVVGMDGEVWKGTFDYTLLRPVNKQFILSFREWRIFTLFDLITALGVLSYAIIKMGSNMTFINMLQFLVALLAGGVLLYAFLLAFSALVFWNSGFLFTWIINDLFQLARFPVGIYPGWLRLFLTWVIPVGLMTTIPAQALSGSLSPSMLIVSVSLAVAALLGASWLLKRGLEKYTSASS